MTTMNPAINQAQPSMDPVANKLKGMSKYIRDAFNGRSESLNAMSGMAGQAWKKTKDAGEKAAEALQALIRAITQFLLRVLKGLRDAAVQFFTSDEDEKNDDNKSKDGQEKVDNPAPGQGQNFAPEGMRASSDAESPVDVPWEVDVGEEDVVDADLKNFKPTPAMFWDPVDEKIVEEEVERMHEAHRLGRATPLLPANKETVVAETQAMQYLTDKVTGRFKDPVASNKLLEAISKAKSEDEVQEIVAKEVFGPTIEEIAKEGEQIRSKLQSDLVEQLQKDGTPVEGFDLNEASRTIVEGLPQNLSKEILPPEKSQVVEEFLRSRATDIRSVLQINAIAGVQSNIFDGTFDFLKRTEGNKEEPQIMTPGSFKLHGKKDYQDQTDVQTTTMRPRG